MNNETDNLRAAFARLDVVDRALLVLYYVDELTPREIAHVLGHPLWHVHERLAVLRLRLWDAADTDGLLGANIRKIRGGNGNG